MTLIQLLLILLVVLFIKRLFSKFRTHELSSGEFVAWLILWLAVGVAAGLPDTTSYLAIWLGVGRGSDLAVYVAVVVLFYLAFRLFVRLEKLEHSLTELVRHLSLQQAAVRDNKTINNQAVAEQQNSSANQQIN